MIMQVPLLLDCTIRDGGYMNAWSFEPPLVRELYKAVSKAGVDYVELGYHGTERFFDKSQNGTWRFSPEEALREVTRGIKGAKVGLMVDSGRFDPADLEPAAGSVVKLVRIASYKTRLPVALKECEAIKAKGYQVSLQLMGYSTYTDQERAGLRGMLNGGPLDFVYVADSYGSIFPNQMAAFLEPVQGMAGIKVGFHPHNQLQMSFANSLEAMRCGADVIDGTVYGIGRAAGNLPMEIFVAYLQARFPDRYNVLPLLNIIDRFFVPLKREHPWGYQLPYMLSGLLNIHPNYAKGLVARREYTIEDVFNGLKQVAQHGGVGFDGQMLESLVKSGMMGVKVKPSAEPNDIKGEVARQPRPAYVNRHQGKDFLILANGPSLKTHQRQILEFMERHQPVVLGANNLGGLFTPHYHAFTNKRRFADYIGSVHPDSKLLLGSNFSQEMIREHTDRDFEWLPFVNRLGEFDIVDGVITASCRTVSVLLCAVAQVMGAERIFLAGMDGYAGLDQGKVHFYHEKDETEDQAVMLEKHRLNLHYLDSVNDYAEAQGREGLHILTPTEYGKFYKGIINYLKD